jgi:hypothetical protein
MRELTGYEDKYGRPILEGDIITSHAGEINVIEDIPEGWFPLCFLEAHEIASIEVIGSAYTEPGRQLLADAGIPAVEDEGELPWDYEETLDARRRKAIEELSSLIRQHYPTATFAVSPDPDDPDIRILWATVDVDDTDQVLDLVLERQLQWQIEEGVPVYVVPIRTPERNATLLPEQPPPQ